MLIQYLSEAWVEQALVFACRDLGHDAKGLPIELHPELVQQVMLRARTFADPERLTEMMLSVAEIFEDETEAIASGDVESMRPLPYESSPGDAPLRVLVVDDDAISRRVISAMLQATGAEVESADSGRRAVEMVEGGQYDVVCMDCFMPDVSGFQATQLIRAREAKGQVPRVHIVAITGQSGASTREHALHVGVDELLVKPVTRAALAVAVYDKRDATQTSG